MTLNDLLEKTLDENASDLHITANDYPYIRVDGTLVKAYNKKLSAKNAKEFSLSLLEKDEEEEFLSKKEIDVSYQFKKDARFRVSVYYEQNTISSALRALPSEIPSMTDLGLPLQIKGYTDTKQGLILFTGPTGHGKTTSAASFVEEINKNRPEHIISIEDPIEYKFKPNKALIHQREVRRDTDSFSVALVSSLRQDPDVIFVGEMRDLNTISTALSLAETGHLVVSTLHTNNASETINRIVDVFPSEQQNQIRNQFSEVVYSIINQRLIPGIKSGRSLAAEVLVSTDAVKNLIRENKSHQINNVIETSQEEGMITLDKSIANLYSEGKISEEQAMLYACDKKNIQNYLK